MRRLAAGQYRERSPTRAANPSAYITLAQELRTWSTRRGALCWAISWAAPEHVRLARATAVLEPSSVLHAPFQASSRSTIYLFLASRTAIGPCKVTSATSAATASVVHFSSIRTLASRSEERRPSV